MIGFLKQLLYTSFEIYQTKLNTQICPSNFIHKLYQMKADVFYTYVMNGRMEHLHIVRAVIWRIHMVALVLQQCFPELDNCVCGAWEKRSSRP